MSQSYQTTKSATSIALYTSLVAGLGLMALPYLTYARNFSGAGTLQMLTGKVMDYSGFPPENLPSMDLALGLGWALFACLLLSAFAALRKASWMWISGVAGLLVAALAMISIHVSLGQATQVLLDQNIPLRRIPFTSGGANMGLVLGLLASLVTVATGLSGFKVWRERMEKLRWALVPSVSFLIAILGGALIIIGIQSVPSGLSSPLTFGEVVLGKFDLIYFVYSTLFAPLTSLPDFLQSLVLATPLILTGLSVAFAFRAGLFNIGAPGQMTIGAICAMLVGVYVPLPAALLLPLTVIAGALGGALWGGLVGWLKARFGSSEVINTIMLNYVAAGIFVFMIGSNEVKFFGQTFHLPFKAEGFEAKSAELQPGAHFPSLLYLFGLHKVGDTISLSWIAGLIVLGIVFSLIKNKNRLWIAALSGIAVTAALWVPMTIQATDALITSRLNVAFLIALLAAAFFGIFLWRTARGYEIRAVGLSPKAAEYGGINVARNTILAMVIAGAFAGLTASHYVMGGALDEFRLKQSLPVSVGFDGITIALLGQSTPVGVVVSSVLFGVLDTGGMYVDQKLDALNRDIVTVLKAIIVLIIAAQGFLSKKIISPPPAAPEPRTSHQEERKEVTA
ncbi:ABC transporter permease [Deinococcus cellulosilyticus]|uniref:ABC transporter permease n=1 Tax=Deinococcus cellulosilyticus (strain DSM 18568 / NBRC 106333 / KACC 11606 / 5516J-15) TaxID=1223518 RepID=A0A511MWT3_DEIC1|nr:ABC transporter permease [Deinococcus cellulosilyticus]GEM44738.1 ABC transporter permease [Deinococcus cellulosilyticus NBRC 106333 = KACC 11606]